MPELDCPENRIVSPFRKLESLTSRVDARKERVLTTPLFPTSTPFSLIIYTCPLASSVPKIFVGFIPITRFKTAADADGWTNLVISPAAIENSFQLITARWDD